MSILKNLLGAFMPHMESRRTVSTLLNAVNAEIIHDLNGDESALIYINGTGTLNATYNVQGSADGVNFFDLVAYPYSPASVGGVSPLAAQPLVSEAVNAATVQRALCVATGGLQKLRVRLTAYTSGNCFVTVNSDECAAIVHYLRDQRAATLYISATGVVNAAVTATLSGVTSLRHYIDRIDVMRSATVALIASATPVLITTTNIPGSPTLTFGADAGGIGVDKMQSFDFGGAGMSASAASASTTIVCPAYSGVIWRVNVAYRLGL